MIIDLADQRSLPAGRCDVCVLGAGPAGISLALELAQRRPDWHIVLAEAGGEAMPTPERNDPYRTDDAPDSPYPAAASRLRFLGGTSNHWGGWCRPLDPEDFAHRKHLPLSGWPLDAGDLAPYYRKAATWCEIDSDDYSEQLLDDSSDPLLDVGSSELLCHKLFRFSPPTRFGERYRDDLSARENLDCWLHATALGMDFDDDHVRRVRFGFGFGADQRANLDARHVVIAMGGLETTRFLLLHQAQGGRNSGLASPMLGRCFADHLGFTPARALLPAGLIYARRNHDSGPLMPMIALRSDAQQALGLANIALTPQPVAELQQLDPDFPHNPAFGFRDGEYWNYRLQMILEPQANPDSRVVLSDQLDRNGVPRLRVDWQMHAGDAERGRLCLRELAADLGRSGLGRLRKLPREEIFAGPPSFVFHHMGSTRMAATAEAGVVDADCRVHGVGNLHVASSSVFPAYGFSNPTLTIVALAMRLAEHLAETGGAQPA